MLQIQTGERSVAESVAAESCEQREYLQVAVISRARFAAISR